MQVKTSTGGYSNSSGDYYARSRAPSAQKFMGPQELAQLVLIIISKKKFMDPQELAQIFILIIISRKKRRESFLILYRNLCFLSIISDRFSTIVN